MDLLQDLQAHLLAKPAVTIGEPFGPGVHVYKVAGKMFLLIVPGNLPPTMNFKVDPDEADELRERWPSVTPGYHMNKRHWSTLAFDGRVPRSLVFEWVERSHDLVVAGLTKKERAAAGL